MLMNIQCQECGAELKHTAELSSTPGLTTKTLKLNVEPCQPCLNKIIGPVNLLASAVRGLKEFKDMTK